MAFELRLTFSGLTALLPHKEATDIDLNPPEWLVVMPALPNGETLELADHPKIPIAPHQAVLVVNAQAVKVKPSKEPRLRFRDPNKATDEQSELLFQLDREVVEIEDPPVPPDSDGVEALLSEELKDLELPDVSQPAQLHDLKWLPQINRCFPNLQGGVPFDRNLFDPVTLIPSSTRLAAVVRLDRGTLETSDVYRKKTDNLPVPYEFCRLSGGKVFEQALASSFRLRVQVEKETATLLLTNSDGDSQRLVVGPYSGSEEGGVSVVEVRVYNRELEEILGFGINFLQDQQAVPDLDFLIFYKLSPVWSTLKAADLVTPQLGGNGGGGRSKPCEPPTYPGVG